MNAPAPQPARAEYQARLARNQALEADAARRVGMLGNLRLALFGLIVAAVVAVGAWDVTAHVLWLPLAGFVALVTASARASDARLRAERAAGLYERGLARLDGDWAGQGRPGDRWRPKAHVYADDLDLFGEGSLFELLCAARSPVGQRRLADWLLAPATPETARGRQGAVAELRDRLDLREDLALVEGEVSTALEHGAASTWGLAPRHLTPRIPPRAHLLAGVVSAVFLVGWQVAGWMPLLMLGAMLVQFLLARPYRTAVEEVLEAADRPARDIDLMGRLLRILEEATFSSPRLVRLQERLRTEGKAPSTRIAELTRLTDFAEARMNQIFLPICWLFSIGTQLACAIEDWRENNGERLADWLDVLAEVEALASLGRHAYEHAADPFPTLVDEGAVFEGSALRHPLLPDDVAVPNDVRLAAGDADRAQGLVVSGSNMSGKSTLLRTVGVNVVLALAGAPVHAASLRVGPLSIGASIRVTDSLREGASRFYAEIERLKAVVDASVNAPPALFLLDEILHGTNSHDRRIGAEAVVRTLLDHGAIGLVTTHDLALVEIAEDAEGPLRNVHFEDHMEDGRMAFDYRLREGVVTHSNALALMRAVGLDVDDPETPAR